MTDFKLKDHIDIQIVTCSNPKYWYKDYVGIGFIVPKKTAMYNGEPCYVVDIRDLKQVPFDTGYILVKDTKKLEKSKPKNNKKEEN